MDMLFIALAVLGLIVGAVLGWFAGSRPVADWRVRHGEAETARRDLDEKFRRAIVELENATVRADRADALESQLGEAREAVAALRAKISGMERDVANFADREKLLVDAREALKQEFALVGTKALEGAQAKFLERAGERFSESEKANEARIKALLDPVGAKLKAYEEQVERLEKQRVDAFGQLGGLIESMRTGQEEVRREAQRLGNSLTNAPKARGRWGERALQNVLEQCGLSEHTDFQLEQSLETEQGRLRPDAIVNVPGQKKLVIDAKVSLNAYQAAFEADNDDERVRQLGLHAKSMRTHVQQLGAKAYQAQFDDAPDYVVMFVPGEHFVAAALEHDPELWDFAFKNGVLLATPTNLVAIARTIAQVWRQDKMASEAQEIGRMGAELHDRLRVASEHLKRVGAGLESAVSNYNRFVGSFERNVLTSGRRMAEKGLDVAKDIDEVPLIASAPRYGRDDIGDDDAVEPEGLSRLSRSSD